MAKGDGLTIHKERFGDIMGDLPELFLEHHKEVDFNNKDIELQPNWQQYANLEANGALHILTARFNGKLVGYFFALVWPSLHFSQTLSAVSDIFFVRSEYRCTGAGLKLLREAERMFKALGATRCYLVTKADSPANIIMGRLGFGLVENVYFKVLKND